MASKLKLTELLYPTSTTAAITINSDDSVTIPTQSTTNLAYTGTLTGGTGVVNLGSGQFYKDASGNVGIGTASPATYGKLAIGLSASAGTNNVFGVYQSSGVDGAALRFAGYNYANNVQTAIDFVQNSASNFQSQITFNTNNGSGLGEKMRIDSSGNVGIGTVSPTSKVYVTTASSTLYGLISQTPVVGLTAGNYVNMAYFSDSRSANNDGLRIVNVRDSTGSGVGDWETSSYRIRRSVDQNDALTGVQEEIVFGSNLLAFNTGGTERMRLDSSGNVTVGSESVNTLRYLDISNTNTGASAGSIIRFITGNAAGSGVTTVDVVKYKTGGFYFNNNDTNAAVFTAFQVGASERMRIDSSGNLLVGTQSFVVGQNSKQISPSIILTSINTTAATGQIVFYNPNGAVGQIYTDGATTVFATSSDYRLKEITGAVTAKEAKDFIMALQPKQGTWKIDGSKFVGFLAHEFKNVSPSSVFGEKDAVDKSNKPIYQGMQAASSEVMANLIALVQEQQALITQLQTDVATLKGAA
jgi:hypothetical protein